MDTTRPDSIPRGPAAGPRERPQVSAQDLRDALARGSAAPPRRAPGLLAPPAPARPPAPSPAERTRTDQLHGRVEQLGAQARALRCRVVELDGELLRADQRECELRRALGELAAAGPWRRRRVLRSLRDRGLA